MAREQQRCSRRVYAAVRPPIQGAQERQDGCEISKGGNARRGELPRQTSQQRRRVPLQLVQGERARAPHTQPLEYARSRPRTLRSSTRVLSPARILCSPTCATVQGWMVALQLMGVGDKWLLYLPSELAYGDVGSTNGWKNIPPHAAISFELELAAVRSDAVPLKVARPPGLTTEALMELAASAAQKPAAAPEGSNDENETPAPTGNASGGGAPVARDGLFERSAVMVRRGGLSDRLRAPPIVSVSASGAAGASATATEVAALRSRLSAAEQTASKHAALVETLSEENRQLRASLDRAIQRAQEWQAEAHALAGEPPVQQHAAAADDDDVEDNDEPPLEVTAGEAPSRAIVLVGVTGGGKSSVGCVLARDDAAFGISAGLSSATAAAAHVDYASIVRLVDGTGNTEERRHVTRIIDTVGLHDTSLPAATAISNFASFEDLVPLAGTDLFLFVMPYGRFSAASEAALDAFLACCGDGALEHTVIVFTRCVLPPDELKAELCRSAPPSLRRILSRLAFPSVIGVDLVRRPRAALKLLRAAVDEGVEALNTERYEPAVLAAALEEYGSGQQEDERAAFATAVSDWRKGGGAAVDVS